MSTLLDNLRVGVDYAAFEAKKQARLLNGQTKVRRHGPKSKNNCSTWDRPPGISIQPVSR